MTKKYVTLDSRTLAEVLKNHNVKIKDPPDAETFKTLLGKAAAELALKKPFGQLLNALYDRVGWVTRAENRVEIKRNSAAMNRPLRQTFTRAKIRVEHSLKSLAEAAEVLVEEKKHFKWGDTQLQKCQQELQVLHEKIAYFESFLAFLIDPTLRTEYEKEVALKQAAPEEYPLGQGSQKLFFDVVLSLDKLIEDFMCDASIEIPKARIDAFILRFCAELGIQHTTEENLHKIRSRTRKNNSKKK